MTNEDHIGDLPLRFAALRRAIRSLFLMDGISNLLVAGVLFLAGLFLVDFLMELPVPVRLLFLGVGLTGALILFRRNVWRRMQIPIPDEDLAHVVERCHPGLRNRLVSAVEFSRQDASRATTFNSPELVGVLVSDAVEAAKDVDFGEVVHHERARRSGMTALIMLIVMGALTFAFPTHAAIFFQRLSGADVRWPVSIHLNVLDFDDRHERIVATGTNVVIGVRVEPIWSGASLPETLWIDYEFEGGDRGAERMTRISDDSFKFEFSSVPGSFRFTVSGGRALTSSYRVRAERPPRIEELAKYLSFPEYLNMEDTPADQPERGRLLRAPFHTRVRFEARTNVPLESAVLILGKGENAREETLEIREGEGGSEGGRIGGVFEVAEGLSRIAFRLRAGNGLENQDPLIYPVQGLPDLAPVIRPEGLMGTELVSDQCVRPLEVVVEDDFGVREAGYEIRLSGSLDTEWAFVPFPPGSMTEGAPGKKKITVRFFPGIDFKGMGVTPGDFVHLRFRAGDYKNVGTPNVSLSREFRFEVIPLIELQKRLEQEIARIRALLQATRTREDRIYQRITDRFLAADGYGSKDRLSALESGEIRESALEQNSVSNQIRNAMEGIAVIRRRGLYNRVFDEAAAEDLVNAIGALTPIVEGAAQGEGHSPLVSNLLTGASRAASARDRREALRRSQDLQSLILEGISEAIRFLQRWSTYQEIIRIARQIWKKQQEVNDKIRGGSGGKNR